MKTFTDLPFVLLERVALSDPRTVATLSCTSKSLRDELAPEAKRLAQYAAPALKELQERKEAAQRQISQSQNKIEASKKKRDAQKKFFVAGLMTNHSQQALLDQLDGPCGPPAKTASRLLKQSPLASLKGFGLALLKAPVTTFRVADACAAMDEWHEGVVRAEKMKMARANASVCVWQGREKIDAAIKRAQETDPAASVPRGYQPLTAEAILEPLPATKWDGRRPTMGTLRAWAHEKGISAAERADRSKAAAVIKKASAKDRKVRKWFESGEYGSKYLTLENLEHLTSLPPFRYSMKLLVIRGCTSLKTLPADLQVGCLWIEGSPNLDHRVPRGLELEKIRGGSVPKTYESACVSDEVARRRYRARHGLSESPWGRDDED